MLDYLADGINAMGIKLPDGALQRFMTYLTMLKEGNQRMNLTAVMDDKEVITKHFLDSISPLSIAEFIKPNAKIADVGTGAGFPGIPLAIVRPDLCVTLMDALLKRVGFLNEVIQELKLNATAIHGRAEDLAKLPEHRERYDVATARAVASLSTLLELTLPFTKVGGIMLAYKGPGLDEELPLATEAIRKLGGKVGTIHHVTIFNENWDHRILSIDKISVCPKKYPRKAGEPGRNPLT